MASAAAVRPLITVQTLEGDMATDFAVTVPLPDVFKAPIRPDVVRFVHSQACPKTAASPTPCPSAPATRPPLNPGELAVPAHVSLASPAAVPTALVGQGAFGNMCRGGRMFAPTKIWRRWLRRVNINMRRYAVVSALAASAVPSLVMARGHRIETVPELPLVVSDSAEGLEKTATAIKVLKQIGAFPGCREG